MTEVMLGRAAYAQHEAIWSWLLDNVGPGGAWQQPMTDGYLWDWQELFGHTLVRFRDQEHAVLFKMVWS